MEDCTSTRRTSVASHNATVRHPLGQILRKMFGRSLVKLRRNGKRESLAKKKKSTWKLGPTNGFIRSPKDKVLFVMPWWWTQVLKNNKYVSAAGWASVDHGAMERKRPGSVLKSTGATVLSGPKAPIAGDKLEGSKSSGKLPEGRRDRSSSRPLVDLGFKVRHAETMWNHSQCRWKALDIFWYILM